MFTGIIEGLGRVLEIKPSSEQIRLKLALPFAKELELGESVAVNGCCLTVAEFDETSGSFDLLSQTLEVTALGDLKEGDEVNLERAMSTGARFGGHFVQGHVDAQGTIVELKQVGQDHRYEVAVPPAIRALCLEKGSITLDGISLTAAEVTESSVVCWITPHTYEVTNLKHRKSGDAINLEGDLFAKYVDQLLEKRLESKLEELIAKKLKDR